MPAFDYMQNAGQDQTHPVQSYTPEQFQQWYQQQHGQAIDPALLQQIGGAVGAPGADGQYTQAQWQQGQSMATAPGANAAPFFPEFQAPVYEAGPAYHAPAAFNYESFQAPTMAQAEQDPGYQFSLKQGLGALQGSQAARGIARTGGAMKGLIDYGQAAAGQQYQNVYNRAAQSYGMNRDNAAGTYATNYQVGRDAWRDNNTMREGAFDRNYRGASDAFNSKFRGRELSFEDLFRRWNTNVNVNAQMALAD